MTGEEATAGLSIAAAGHALNDHAIGNDRAGGISPAFFVISDLLIPSQFAGFGIDGNDMRITGRDNQIIAIKGLGALTIGGHAIGQTILILPKQFTCRCIESLNQMR